MKIRENIVENPRLIPEKCWCTRTCRRAGMPRTLNLQTACPLSGKIMLSLLIIDVTIVAIGFYVDMLRSSQEVFEAMLTS